MSGRAEVLHELRRGEYLVSTDRSRLDLPAIHAFLTRAYWSEGVPYAAVERGIANSLPFGAYYDGSSLAGFARVITDFASFAYLPTSSCWRHIAATGWGSC